MHLGLRGEGYESMRLAHLIREVREYQRAARYDRQALAYEVARTLFGVKEDEGDDQLPEEATLAIAQQLIRKERERNGSA
ncbi:hypothetical protein [Gaopeijia maritima]|uniref:hypothetical protein n=1 Tax=Gaopeijia maritima TaxID=3119007 RepID=UPI0032751D67